MGARGDAGDVAPFEPTDEVSEEVMEAAISEFGWSFEYCVSWISMTRRFVGFVGDVMELVDGVPGGETEGTVFGAV